MKKLILLVLVCTVSTAGFTQKTLEDSIQVVLEELQRGSFQDAAKHCDELIAQHPDVPTIYVLKGEALSENITRKTKNIKVYNSAMAAYSKALELDSTHALALHSAMLINMFHQKYDKAIEYAIRLAEHAEEEWQFKNAILNMANCYGYLGDHEKSIKAYLMAIKVYPESPDYHNNLALAYHRNKEFDKAQEYAYKAIELKPEDLMFKGNLAYIFTSIDKYEEAIQIYDEILAKEVSPISYNNRGYAKLKLGNYEAALKDINFSLKLYPENSYAYRNRALVYIEMKKTDEACKDLKKANELGYSISYGKEVNQLLEKHCKE